MAELEVEGAKDVLRFVYLGQLIHRKTDNNIPPLCSDLGIDRFMSEARALTNLIGNGVATVVVSRWEKLDLRKLHQVLDNKFELETEMPKLQKEPFSVLD